MTWSIRMTLCVLALGIANRAQAADCPGILVLDWVGTNGAPGGRETDEPVYWDIALNSQGDCGLAGAFRGSCDIDPTDAVDVEGAAGSHDVLINLVDPLGYSQNLTVGAEGWEMGSSIAWSPSGGWYYSGLFSVNYSYEYCMDFNPYPDDEDKHCAELSSYDDGSFITYIDEHGRYRWTHVLADVRGSTDVVTIAATPDGGIVFAGFFEGTIDLGYGPINSLRGGRDVLLASMDERGALQWAVTFGGDTQDEGELVTVDVQGNIYLLGRFAGTVDFDPGSGIDERTAESTQEDMFISKYTADGNYLWTRTMNTNESHLGYSIKVSNDNRLLIAGYFQDRVDFDSGEGVDERVSAGEGDAFVTVWTTDGDYLWTHTWGAEGYETACADFDGNGDVIVAGGFNDVVDFDTGPGQDLHTSNGGADCYVAKYTADGQYQWVETFGGPMLDTVLYLAVNPSNGDVWLSGLFRDSVDFDPGPGEVWRTTVGERDRFLMKMSCGGGGCEELINHSVQGTRGKINSTVMTTLTAGKAYLEVESLDGATYAKGKAAIAADGTASKLFKHLPPGLYHVRVAKLKDVAGNRVCSENPFERTVEVR